MNAKVTELLERRAALLGPNVLTTYEEPVHIVRGEGVRLWDADGREFLDCYNNVPHVGHCHPRVVEALCRQASTLNTHTRYLHEGILDYIERLTDTFDDDELNTAIMVCTGSEANDIALRMVQAVTGKRGIIVTDNTYHGNTSAVAQLSRTYEPKVGVSDHIRFVPAPDSYRPLGGEAGMSHARIFARKVAEAIEDLERSEHGFGGILLCPAFFNEGFPDLEAGWLDPALAVVRQAGGLFIADEVQPGFGRTGERFWGHQRIKAGPDIVTMGKPMGNGHPVAAVVTKPPIMAAFRDAFHYFNTFGGNPVSCAVATAVLDVLQSENLQENARLIGAYARDGLRRLGNRYEWVGDVRGFGLFFGAEIVLDRATKQPAPNYVRRVVNEMRKRGILLDRHGLHGNTLKIRPPMPFSRENADLLLDTLDRVFGDLGAPRD